MNRSFRPTALTFLGFLFAGTLSASWVMAQEKMYFSVDGATSGSPNYKESPAVSTCTEQDAYIDISGTYTVTNGKKITIAPINVADGFARVVCNEADDKLILRNAKITTTDASGIKVWIAFWRKFAAPPSPSGDYSVSAEGNFESINTNNSWLSLRGHVDSLDLGGFSAPAPDAPVCTALLTKCPKANQAATWTFSKNGVPAMAVTSPVDDLADPRTLKGQFWFKFAANSHVLKFNFARGIQVNFGPPPGPEPTTCPAGQQCRGECPEGPKWLLPTIILLAIMSLFSLWRSWTKKQ